jgi:hypothetical protein
MGSADYPDGWIIFLDLRRDLKQAVPLKLPMNIGDGDMTLLHLVFSPDDSSLWINENEFASSTSPPTPSPFDGEGELSEAQRG